MTKRQRKSQFEGFRDSLDGFLEDVCNTIDHDKKQEAPKPAALKNDPPAGSKVKKKRSRIISGSYQDHTDTVSVSYQYDTDIVSPSDQENIISGSYQNQDQDQDHIIISLSARQQQLYDWLVAKGLNGSFTKPQIQKATGIPYITIRKALEKFQKEGILNIQYNTCQKLTFYQFNTKKTVQKYQDQDQDHIISGSHQDHISSLLSSSSLLNKTTPPEIDQVLSTHPELGYWRQKKLNAKQVMEWMKTAGCNLDTMIQYLCYCRFDMVDLGMEKSKPIDNVFNWFFKILEKSGGYAKPKGYKSYQDKQIEQERAIVKQQDRQIQELKDLCQQKYRQQKDLEFWQMMSDPEGELYKQCFDCLNDFTKKRAAKGGPIFESAMRKAFDEITEASDANEFKHHDPVTDDSNNSGK